MIAVVMIFGGVVGFLACLAGFAWLDRYNRRRAWRKATVAAHRAIHGYASSVASISNQDGNEVDG